MPLCEWKGTTRDHPLCFLDAVFQQRTIEPNTILEVTSQKFLRNTASSLQVFTFWQWKKPHHLAKPFTESHRQTDLSFRKVLPMLNQHLVPGSFCSVILGFSLNVPRGGEKSWYLFRITFIIYGTYATLVRLHIPGCFSLSLIGV